MSTTTPCSVPCCSYGRPLSSLISSSILVSSTNERAANEQVLVIESPEALISEEERAAAANNPDLVPNPLAWLPPELPPHVKASGVAAAEKNTSIVRIALCGVA